MKTVTKYNTIYVPENPKNINMHMFSLPNT